jgi:hypothetical protein
MPVQPVWECLRLAQELAYQRFDAEYFALPTDDSFEPGDLAYHNEGSLHEAFIEMMKKKGHELSPFESLPQKFKRVGRYCLVLRRLRDDQYIICYLTSFGGARKYGDVTSLLGRVYGLPLGENIHWPGIPSLRTRPMWKGGFILAIPVIRQDLRRTNLAFRCRLTSSELERAKQLIRERQQVRGRMLHSSCGH